LNARKKKPAKLLDKPWKVMITASGLTREIDTVLDGNSPSIIIEEHVVKDMGKISKILPTRIEAYSKEFTPDRMISLRVDVDGCKIPISSFVVPDGTLGGIDAIVGTEELDDHGIIIDRASKKLIAKHCDERFWVGTVL
jgi:hypothetical protein